MVGVLFGLSALSAIFPGECPSCGVDGENKICFRCLEQVPSSLVDLPIRIPFVLSSQTMAPYDGPIGSSLRRAKYRPDEKLCKELADLLCFRIQSMTCDLDVVVGVPQSPWTTLRRAYSPVDCVTRAVAGHLGLPVKRPVRRNRGASIASLNKGARDGVAISQYSAVDGQEVQGRDLLIDDVVTTGATASAVSRVLLQQGASSVQLLSLASPSVA